jgi:hypothetical protein
LVTEVDGSWSVRLAWFSGHWARGQRGKNTLRALAGLGANTNPNSGDELGRRTLDAPNGRADAENPSARRLPPSGHPVAGFHHRAGLRS